MAENVTIARPYAEAVFALADAEGALGRWSQMLAVFAVVGGESELRAAIAPQPFRRPGLRPVRRRLRRSHGEAQNLVRVLIENGRLATLPADPRCL